ncbi:MAG: SDR family oxidoreductase [Planctomycetota bacterium]
MSRVVLITGSSSGIGKATAEAFARLGDRVLLCGQSTRVFQIQKELQKKYPQADFQAFQFDLKDPDAIKKTLEKIHQKNLEIDVLVNNAGVSKGGTLESISLNEWNELISINLTSCFLLAQALVPGMKARKHGKIINVSSIAGRSRSKLAGVHYTTTKAALIGFTRQLAQELAPFGIRVNAICPSQTRTPMLESFLTPEVEEKLKSSIPLGYIARPEDIAPVIVFLASSAADYMTGAIVDINGGQY